MYAGAESVVRWLARMLALIGGLVLVAMTVLTVLSITGRGLIWAGLGPVPGDYELVEMGAAFTIFSFLPWCQLQRGHVTVDLFLSSAGEAVNRAVDMVSDVLLTGVAALIAWRLFYGMHDKLSYNETTYILQLPLWIGYALSMVGACLFVLISAFSIWRSAHLFLLALRPKAGEGK